MHARSIHIVQLRGTPAPAIGVAPGLAGQQVEQRPDADLNQPAQPED
jgi:hypothetical protein